MSQIKLGVYVKDKISGFKGYVVSIINHIDGANRAEVVAKGTGHKISAQWISLKHLEVVDKIDPIVLHDGSKEEI